MKNVAKNFFYQAIFQLSQILLPIITVPIVANALGPKGVGLYNYTFSVVQYFSLFAGLGVALYGNRQIALAWNKKEKVSQTFWEIFTFKAVSTIFFLVLYFFLVLVFFDHKIFYFVQSLSVLAVLFDISWFFMGVEDFKKTSMTNLFIQIVTFILIVFFVKDEGDTLFYVTIQSVGTLASQIIIWYFLRTYVKVVPISFKKSMRHFKGSVEFFLPKVAVLLYTNLNKTLLGLMIGTTAVGYYSNALRLNDIFVTLIATLDIVLLPHMSGLFAKQNNSDRIVELMDSTIHLQLFFSIPIMFGMLTVYDKLIPWFFGSKFLFINQLIPIFSLLIIIKPLGGSIAKQYLMPIGKINQYNRSVVVGAIINIVVNLLLLPTIGFYGVVIAVLLAEFFVTFVRVRAFMKDTAFKFNFHKIGIYLFSAGIMYVLTRYLTNSLTASALTNTFQLLIAVPIYFILTTILGVNPLLEILQVRKK